MPVTAEIRSENAFVLRLTEVEAIWSLLGSAIGGVTAKVSCVDGIQREFESASDLAAYDNVASRSIHGLTIRARSEDRETSASMSFNSGFTHGVRLNIEGPEDLVIVVRDKLQPLIADLRPWYSLIARIDFFYVIWPLLVFMWMVLLGMADSSKPSKVLTFAEASRAAAIGLLFLVGVGGLVWGLNRLRERFFPDTFFALGRGVDRYHFDEKIRWVVIVGFVVNVVASLFVAFFVPAA